MVLKGLTLDRLQDRVGLLKAFDSLEPRPRPQRLMDGMDAFHQQALGILTSSKLVDALDLSKEDPQVVARYGVDDPAFERDGAPRMVRNFCLARRLVEAGARVVTLNFSRWDWHGADGKNFVQGRKDMPLLDQAVSALVADLHERGLDRTCRWWSGASSAERRASTRRRPRPLAAGQLCPAGRRRHADRPGHRRHQPPGRARGQTAGDAPGNLRHALHQHRLEPEPGARFDPNGRPQYLVEPGRSR